MNKRKISEEVYDRYVDASVALFMEYYASSCLDNADDPHIDEVEFPADLDSRCRTLIDREFARQRRKTFFKAAAKGLGVVAAFAAVILSLSSVLFMTVEAVRVPIINYYIEQGDSYWEISSQNGHSSEHETQNTISLSDPLANLIPNDYKLSTIKGDTLSCLIAIYKNADGQKVSFSTGSIDGATRFDTENAQTSKTTNILGYNAFMVIKGNQTNITWIIDDLSLVISLDSTGLTSAELAMMAEQLTMKLTN